MAVASHQDVGAGEVLTNEFQHTLHDHRILNPRGAFYRTKHSSKSAHRKAPRI